MVLLDATLRNCRQRRSTGPSQRAKPRHTLRHNLEGRREERLENNTEANRTEETLAEFLKSRPPRARWRKGQLMHTHQFVHGSDSRARFARVAASTRKVHDRAGFTLLETILAISLITVLFVAILQTTSLYVQYRARSVDGNRLVKVLNGTVEDLRNDLRACYPGDQTEMLATKGPPQDSAFQESILGSQIGERFLSFENDANEQAIHFVGRPDAILLLRQGQNGRFGVSHYPQNQQQVLWLAPRLNSVRLPKSVSAGRPSEREFRAVDSGTGLKRTCFPVSGMGGIPQSPSAGRSGTQIWDTNQEVQRVEFRYFDGVKWLKEWNSHSRNEQIPLAVEVRLVLAISDARNFRVVIRLPGAYSPNSDLDTESLLDFAGFGG